MLRKSAGDAPQEKVDVSKGNLTKTHHDESSPSSVGASRRRLLKTGALLVPVVLTLRATPAWAQTDYMLTAYRYGTNKGLCRNPDFNQHAQGGPKSVEFIPCPPGDDVVL